jgi:hypothetical protein
MELAAPFPSSHIIHHPSSIIIIIIIIISIISSSSINLVIPNHNLLGGVPGARAAPVLPPGLPERVRRPRTAAWVFGGSPRDRRSPLGLPRSAPASGDPRRAFPARRMSPGDCFRA